MSALAKVGLYTTLGMTLPAGAVIGYGLGWLLDRRLHTAPMLALILAVAGAAAGLIEVLRILNRTENDDDPDTLDDTSGPK